MPRSRATHPTPSFEPAELLPLRYIECTKSGEKPRSAGGLSWLADPGQWFGKGNRRLEQVLSSASASERYAAAAAPKQRAAAAAGGTQRFAAPRGSARGGRGRGRGAAGGAGGKARLHSRGVSLASAMSRSTAEISAKIQFDQLQAVIRKRAARLPAFALISEASRGYVSAELPPRKPELFVHASGERLSLQNVFAAAAPRAGKGGSALYALGAGAILGLCETTPGSADMALCLGGPAELKPPRVGSQREKSAQHRKLMLRAGATSAFVLEIVG